jgi:lipoyl(octanoyl) transferase
MGTMGKTCGVMDWGREPYGRVLDWQRELVAARKAGRVPDLLLLGEHTPVITLGRNARREHIRLPEAELARRGVELHETDRGGDVTYHGPGQLVGYPIVDLSRLRKDLVWYVRSLEEVLIRSAAALGVEAKRKTAPSGKRQLYTGVWVGEEKLAAIGVHVSRWVTSHGFALNVTTDLSPFDFIVPCGLDDKGVTSLERLFSPAAPAAGLMARAKAAIVQHFGEVFGRTMITLSREELEERVGAQQAAAS